VRPEAAGGSIELRERVVQLNLTEDDSLLLQDLLERAMAELREEVYKTDTFDYREALRSREAHLAAMLGAVRNGVASQG
jgi:hypothetical protein